MNTLKSLLQTKLLDPLAEPPGRPHFVCSSAVWVQVGLEGHQGKGGSSLWLWALQRSSICTCRRSTRATNLYIYLYIPNWKNIYYQISEITWRVCLKSSSKLRNRKLDFIWLYRLIEAGKAPVSFSVMLNLLTVVYMSFKPDFVPATNISVLQTVIFYTHLLIIFGCIQFSLFDRLLRSKKKKKTLNATIIWLCGLRH